MKYLSLAVSSAALITSNAYATTVTVDPDGTGANGVFLNNPSQIIVGFGREGTLEIDAGGFGFVTVRGDNLFAIGYEDTSRPRSSGLLRVIGNGTAGTGDAKIASDNSINVGFAGDGRLEMSNGAELETPNLDVGNGSNRGEVEASGETTVLEINSLDIRGTRGFAEVDSEFVLSDFATTNVTREEGFLQASVSVDGEMRITEGSILSVSEGFLGVSGDVTVDTGALVTIGDNPGISETSSIIGVSRNPADVATLRVDSGAIVDMANDIQIGGSLGTSDEVFDEDTFESISYSAFGSNAEVTVTNGGELYSGGDIIVSDSYNPNEGVFFNLDGTPIVPRDGVTDLGAGSGRLTVEDGGFVSASRVVVRENGILDGDGGVIAADVVLEGGSIAPGASPGRMDIFGNLEVISGSIDMEIGGLGLEMFDRLFITGDLIAPGGFDLNISFIDGFLPSTGDVFDLFDIGGDASIFDTAGLVTTNFFGLPSDYLLDFGSTSPGQYALTVTSTTSVAPVPIPASMPLLIAGLFGLGALTRRKKTA